MQVIYETERYAERNPTWHEEDAPWKARHVEAMLRKNGLRFRTLCEVGCGTGEILRTLSGAFPAARFEGYEISPHAYARARSRETDRLSFRLADLLEEDVYFDVVLAADVIEHVENYVSFLKALKERGRYKIFHIPLDLSAQSVLRGWPITNLRSSVGHLHYFFKDTALATLTDCGYTIVDWKYTASRLELPAQAFSSELMRLPRRLLYAIRPDLAVRVLGGYSLMVLAE